MWAKLFVTGVVILVYDPQTFSKSLLILPVAALEGISV